MNNDATLPERAAIAPRFFCAVTQPVADFKAEQKSATTSLHHLEIQHSKYYKLCFKLLFEIDNPSKPESQLNAAKVFQELLKLYIETPKTNPQEISKQIKLIDPYFQ